MVSVWKWLTQKAAKREPTEMDSAYAAASIRLGEEYGASSVSAVNQVDYNRVARGVTGSIWNAASIVATECASHPLKLYRRAGAGRLVGRAQKIGSRQAEFLKGKSLGYRPTAKAVTMAEAAGDVEEVTEHPVLGLLADPDPVTTASDFLTMLYFYREVAGKSYVWTGGAPGANGPAGLYILHPQFTQPVLDKRSLIRAYRYGRDTTSVMEVPAEEVIFSPYARDPFRPWDGISWLSSIEAYADAENAALVTEVNRWKNAGQPGFILKVPMSYTDNQMKQAEAALRSKGGPFSAGRALIIREAELVQSAAKTHEMGYVAGLEQAEKAIYRAAGIPEAIWKLNDSNLAGAKLGERLLLRACFKRMARVAEDLTSYLLPMYGEEAGALWFGYENPDLEDQQIEASIMGAAYRDGVIDADEYRKVLYLPPRETREAVSDSELVTETPAAGAAMPEDNGAEDTGDVESPEHEAAESEALSPDGVKLIAELAGKVTAGELPLETVRGLVAAAYPDLLPEQVAAILEPLAAAVEVSGASENQGNTEPAAVTRSGARAGLGRGAKQATRLEHRSAGELDKQEQAEQAGADYAEPAEEEEPLELEPAEEPEREVVTKELPEFVPPPEARAEAEQGLEWRREYGRGGTEVGVARARDISNGRVISPDTVLRIVSYFARHQADKEAEGFREGEPGYPSAGRIAYALWGGEPMREAATEWAALIEAEEEAAAAEADKGSDMPERETDNGCENGPELETKPAEACKPMAEGEACKPKPKSVTVGRYEWAGRCACACTHKAANGASAELQRLLERQIAIWGERNLRTLLGSLKPDGSFDVSSMDKQGLIDKLSQSITAAFEVGAEEFLANQGDSESVPLSGDPARKYVERYTFELVQGVTDTMANQLRTEIDRELAGGTTYNQMSQALADKIPDISLSRAETIARTETARAVQNGSLQQSIEMGYTGKVWILSGNPCGLCEAAFRDKGKEATPIGDPFYPAGAQVTGTDGVTYTISYPVMVASEIHPNCGCGTIEEV